MNAREYLMQLQYLRMAIKTVEEQIEEVRHTMTQLNAIRYDKEHVQQTSDDTMLNCIIRIEAAEEKYAKLLDQYNERYTIALTRIEGLENDLHRRVLLLRYVGGIPLYKIAVELGYSFEWIRHVHKHALQAFQEKYLEK